MSNGLTSFLTQGTPVAAPTGSDTTSQFPLWLQQSIYNTLGAATNLAQQPYTPYPGPTVATPSAQTQQAWQLAGQNVGNWNPYLTQAANLTQQASQPISQNQIQSFLNPYQNYITNALDTNLMQNVLPGVQSQFVSAGQAASPQQAQLTNQAIYGTQQAVGQSLANAYQGALSSLQQQQQQMGALGAQYGQLGALTSQLGASDVGQLAAAGQGQDTLAQQNINSAMQAFYNQQQWPYQQLGFLSNLQRGAPVNTSQQVVGTAYLPPNYYSASPLATYLGTSNAASSLGLKRGGPVRGALSSLKRAA